MNKIVLASITKPIKRYFGILFDKGYKIREVTSFRSFGNWEVILESPKSIITIYCDRSEISLVFSPVSTGRKFQIDIRTMIYYLNQESVFIGFFEGSLSREKKKQYQRLSGLLKEYIDKITPCFGPDFEKHKHNLILAQNKYNRLLLEKSTHKEG